MSKDSGAGDVGRLDRIRIGVLTRGQHVDKLVGEVWMGPAVPCSLGKGEVLFSCFTSINSPGCERRNFLGKQVTKVG